MATQLAGDLPSNRGGRVLRPSVVSTTQYLRRWPRVHEPSPIVSLSFVAAQGGEPEKRESRKPPRVLTIGWPWSRVSGAPNGPALFVGQPDTASDCAVSALSSSSVSHPSSSYLFLLCSEMHPMLGVAVGMGRTCESTVSSTAALASSYPSVHARSVVLALAPPSWYVSRGRRRAHGRCLRDGWSGSEPR
jgi:hypothetical protein